MPSATNCFECTYQSLFRGEYLACLASEKDVITGYYKSCESMRKGKNKIRCYLYKEEIYQPLTSWQINRISEVG